MNPDSALVTFLFTDIEGSSLLWEREPERMRKALAQHDAITRAAVEVHRGEIVKMVGDGAHAAFGDPLDAISAAVHLQRTLADPAATNGVELLVRCGIHVGADERRDNDFFGRSVNRAARIMGAAHGGQVLLSQAVATLVREQLPSAHALHDLGSVRLRDLALPERVFQLLHPALRREFPALRSLDATPNNLPLQLTSFIGRDREMAEVKRLLTETRLLTVLGSGGIGKTRLALQVAVDLLDDYSDGVWFVELASVTDGRIVPQAVASVLGVREDAGRPVLEAIKAFTKARRLLIVLDNCEHLLAPCAELAGQLLALSPGLTLLASSREPLRVPGEITFQVPPLSTPVGHAMLTHTTLLQFEAARLFVERATAVQPEIQMTHRGVLAVADICQRLDGIPLAIELAAVHARVLPVEKIAERLIDRLRLLTRGSRIALPRQRTLRASIDWSYDLLTRHEQALLRRVAVFSGGWTIEAAEALGKSEETFANGHDVLDSLSNLVEKSLVSRDPDGSRYHLLESVRQYAQERSQEAGDETAIRSLHLDYYLAMVEVVEDSLDSGAKFERLDRERENLFVAFESCALLPGGAHKGLRLAYALKHWVLSRGLFALGYRLMVDAISRNGAETRDLARCQALCVASELAFQTGRYAAARQHVEESLSIAGEIRDPQSVVDALRWHGFVLLAHADGVAAQESFESALSISRELKDKSKLAAALNGLAELHRSRKDSQSALPLYREALALDREVGDRRRLAVHLCNFAGVLITSEECEASVDVLLEALTIAEEIASKQVGRVVLEYCACLAAVREQWAVAACLYGSAEKQSEDMGYHREPMDAEFLPHLIARARQALDPTTFAAEEAAGRARSYAQAIREAHRWLRAPPQGGRRATPD